MPVVEPSTASSTEVDPQLHLAGSRLFLRRVKISYKAVTEAFEKMGFMQNSDSVLGLSDKASFRSLGDSGVILMTDSGQLYSCNSTAEAFLRRMDGDRTIAAIASEIGEEFDVEPNVLLADLEEIISYLISEGVVVSVGNES